MIAYPLAIRTTRLLSPSVSWGILVTLFSFQAGLSQVMTASELIDKSIEYHDPHGLWPTFNSSFVIQQINPKQSEQSYRTVTMDRSTGHFSLMQQTGDEYFERIVEGESCSHRYNHSDQIPKDIQEKYRMSCERANMYKDYFDYLYGLPMKLKDPGTIIDPSINMSEYNGHTRYVVKVSYDPTIGDDTWYFYFDTSTYALSGYRFYHDESKNDGEYITLYGEEDIDGIRMPKNRLWYYNNDDLFLGADLLLSKSNSDSSPDLTVEDFDRASSMRWRRVINKKVFREVIRPNWFQDSTGFWFHFYNPDGRSFLKYVFDDGESSPLFDHQRMSSMLNEISNDSTDKDNLPISYLEYMDREHVLIEFSGERFKVNLDKYEYEKIPKDEEEASLESLSPDGKWLAYVKEYNLYLKNVETEEEIQLSHHGSKHYQYASYYGWFDLMHGETSDRPENFYVNWSPDSKFLQLNICDTRFAQKMYMLDWSVDTLFRPNLLSYYRGSPGDTTLVHYIPMFYSIDSLRWMDHSLQRHSHINTISYHWSENEGVIYADIPSRGYQEEKLIRFDLINGTEEILVHEKSATNIDNFSLEYAEDLEKVIFLSERSGWRQLYAYDLKARNIYPITNGDYFVHRVERVDRENSQLYFTASGMDPDQNPYWRYLYKINLDGSQLTLLTKEIGHHEISLSPDGLHFLDNHSTLGFPTVSILRNTSDGSAVDKISSADARMLLESGWTPPQSFEAIGRDEETKLYGALWRPSNFDPSLKYPVIDHSYTGPHTQMYPKSFASGIWRDNQALAELGFIVVMIDGMGTSGRSKEFHNVSYKNMGMNLVDHVLAIKQLGQRYTWIDTSRVGIFGHSAGGYDAGHGLLQFPDFYKVGVASSADHDFRMEKAWWPEMYMGWPVDSTYHEVSNVTMASNLKGKLLIVHGALDDNVNASASFKLAEALIDADKPFDFLILPSQRHGYSDPRHQRFFIKKRWNYFVEHLLGKNPIWNFDL